MIYEEYEARIQAIPFPDRKAIKEDVFKGFEEFVGTKSEIDARQRDLHDEVKRQYSEARNKRGKAVDVIYQDFKAALSNHYGTEHKEIDDKIFQKAWDEGHSSGLHEVEIEYDDLAELAQFIYDKASK